MRCCLFRRGPARRRDSRFRAAASGERVRRRASSRQRRPLSVHAGGRRRPRRAHARRVPRRAVVGPRAAATSSSSPSSGRTSSRSSRRSLTVCPASSLDDRLGLRRADATAWPRRSSVVLQAEFRIYEPEHESASATQATSVQNRHESSVRASRVRRRLPRPESGGEAEAAEGGGDQHRVGCARVTVW